MNKHFRFLFLFLFIIVLSSFVFATRHGAVYDPNFFTNVNLAFDDNSTTFANKTTIVDVSLGRTFREQVVLSVDIKADFTYSAGSSGVTSLILQSYNGLAWSTETTLDTDNPSATYDSTYFLNKTVQGLRVYFDIPATSTYIAKLYNLEWDTKYDEYYIQNTTSVWYLNDTNAEGEVNETGNVTDSWGSNDGTLYGKTFNHGTNNGATLSNSSPVNGSLEKFGGYYDFDGMNDYVDINSKTIGNDEYIGFWHKSNAILGGGEFGQIVSDSGTSIYNSIYFHANGRLNMATNSSNYCYGTYSNDLEWHYYIIGKFGGSCLFYEDGIDITDDNSMSGNIVINRIGGSTYPLNGSLDEMKFYSGVSYISELNEEMNANAVANPEGIVAYYDFNEQSGTTAYDNNHLSTGARQSTASIDDPVFSWDKSINFDGVDDHVDLNSDFYYNISQTFTYSFFIKSSSDETQYFMGNDIAGVNWFQLNSGNKLWVEFTTNGDYCIGDSINYKDNLWHNYIIVVNKTNCKFYEDSIELIMSDNTRTSSSNISRIGNRGDTSSSFNGSIADVRIYDSELTEQEIKTLYHGLKQINLNSEEYVSISSVNNFNIISVYGNKNTTSGTIQLDVPYGNITVNLWESLGYFNQSNINFNIIEGVDTYTFDASNANLTVYAHDLVNDVPINNFTFNLTSVEYPSFAISESTTSGEILFNNNLIQGNYTYVINADDYAITSGTIELSSFNTTLNASIYTTNSINLTISDEETKVLINQLVNVELISDSIAYNYSTTNGTLYLDSILPETYNLRLSSSGYSTRYYTFTLSNRTHTELNRYLLNSSSTTDLTVTIINEEASELEGALVKCLKYDVSTNDYILQQSLITNVDGIVVFPVELNTEYYYFIVEYPISIQVISTTPALIYSDTVTIQVQTGETGGTGWTKTLNVYSNITYYNTTNEFVFKYNDAESTVSEGCLYVYESSSTGLTLKNSSCVLGASNTATVAYDVAQGKLYVSKGYVKINGAYYLINELETLVPLDNIYNYTSLFLIGILILAFAMVGLKTGPAAVISLPVIGLIAARIMGLINPLLTTGLLISLFVLTMILAIILKRRDY